MYILKLLKGLKDNGSFFKFLYYNLQYFNSQVKKKKVKKRKKKKAAMQADHIGWQCVTMSTGVT